MKVIFPGRSYMFTKRSRPVRHRFFLLVVLAVEMLGLQPIKPVHAAILVVTNMNDSGTRTSNVTFNAGEEFTILNGFQVSGRDLLDVNGNSFVMRGINYPHNWYPDETGSFADIKAEGANTVRVV